MRNAGSNREVVVGAFLFMQCLYVFSCGKCFSGDLKGIDIKKTPGYEGTFIFPCLGKYFGISLLHLKYYHLCIFTLRQITEKENRVCLCYFCITVCD